MQARRSSSVEPSGEQIELAAGDQRAVVVEVGGGLRTYSTRDRDHLDGYAVDAMASSGRGQVLAPWPNRLEDGSYEFGGRSHQLPLSEPARHNAIHGLVRWASWRLVDRAADRARLEYILHPRPGYPFSLALGVEYALGADGLAVHTTATNLGGEPCPYGAGAHPYLTVGSSTVDSAVLRLPARTVLQADERGLPVGAMPVDATDYDFRKARPIGSVRLDHAFTDLERDGDGLARVELRHPESGEGLTLWVDAHYGYLMLFTGDPLPDVQRRSLAVEPMTCPPNAFRTGESLLRLEPGESVTTAWGLSPTSGR
jgi:aldose 1-epimerase